ncbi:MAG: hypothetical protein ACLP9L_01805 [Thermoguttaceae bacterium]
MPDRNAAKVPECKWRVEGRCLNRVIERMRDEKGKTQRRESVAGRSRRPTLRELVARIPTTGAAAKDLDCNVVNGKRCRHARTTPVFKRETRVLRFRGAMVKRFSPQARNQIAILVAFQNQGWPRWIENPLGNRKECGSEKPLKNAVYRLNLACKSRLIRFACDGDRAGWVRQRSPAVRDAVSRSEK